MGNIILVGGYAMRDCGFSRPHAASVDLDIIGKYNDVISFIRTHKILSCVPDDGGNKIIAKVAPSELNGFAYRIIEAEIAWSGSTAAEFMDLVGDLHWSGITTGGTKFLVPNMSQMYALKMSHRYLRNNPHFVKTMLDIKLMRSEGGFSGIPEDLIPWFMKREAATYTYTHPKLNVSKDAFFKDDVPYIYDHDTIHEAVKIGDRPAYTYFLEGQVKTSKKLFNLLPEHVKLRAVYEEVCVLALERSIIPYGLNGGNGEMQFIMALQKVCTSITSGWFREYAWENYNVVLAMFNPTFISRFNIALNTGDILPFKGTKY